MEEKNTGIVLQGSDFILEQTDPGSFMFDLQLKKTVHGKNGVDREEFKQEAYGLPLTLALWRVAIYHTSKNNYPPGKYSDLELIMKFLLDFKRASNAAGKELKELLSKIGR